MGHGEGMDAEETPWLAYCLSFALPMAGLVGNFFGGWFSGLAIFLGLGLFPILDHFSGESREGSTPPRREGILRGILYTHALLNPLIIALLLYRVSLDGFGVTTLLAGFSTGIACGTSGIVVGHELGHTRPKSFGWWLAKLNLTLSLHNHFVTEHNYNHHKNVGLPSDPVCAPQERGLWIHALQSLPRQLFSAWRIERGRRKKRGKSTSPLMNPVLHGLIVEGLVVAAIWLTFGQWGVLAFVYQAAVAIFLLEYVNYIEHYGLTRGEGERQTEHHSWQTEKRFTRFTLFELARHSSHHLEASLPYWKLKPFPNAPQLPSGYFALFWVSIIPPIWRRVMDPHIPKTIE